MTQIGTRQLGGLVKAVLTAGGTGYTSAPTVNVAGSGTGASVIAVMAGTVVKEVLILKPGTGYSSATLSFVGAGGTGADATAAVYTGSTINPVCFFKGRFNDVYGVDGTGRGFRWNGTAAAVQAIGLAKPGKGPAITAGTTASKYVASLQIVGPGAGYNQPPTVTIEGGGYTTQAKAIAQVSNGRLVSVSLSDQGSGYTSIPKVTVSGGQGSGSTLSVGIVGEIFNVAITNRGGGLTAGELLPISFSSAQGLTQAAGAVLVGTDGCLADVYLYAAGTGATTEGVTASCGVGSLQVNMQYRVSTVAVGNSGSGYMTPPFVSFRCASNDSQGYGAAGTAYVNATGNVTGVSVYQGGRYYARPEAIIYDTPAAINATLSSNFRGVYQCAIRFIDDNANSQGGPVPSSISELVEVDVGEAASSFTWNFNFTAIDDRVTAMELWRTSADQSVVLYRVATIQRASFASSYVEAISDVDLIDTTRSGYGLMPVTLPSGQLNARRFEVPPGNCAVGCMFQDRAWYAVDTTGEKPNSLLYSEVDEPESVPEANELVLQENTDEPDKIVALVPLSTALLVIQQYHIYRLQYVAQPVIDASVLLVSYRGILNSRCYTTINGVAYIADSMGMYAFDGQQESPVSVPVDNFWRDRIIDFTKSALFHVSADHQRRVVRFHYCRTADTLPTRALCYCIATQAWWDEQYDRAMTASAPVTISGQRIDVLGTSVGTFVKPTALVDVTANVSYSMRTGNYKLAVGNKDRTIEILYEPTSNTHDLTMKLHFNNSPTSRNNAIAANTGGFGFVSDVSGSVVSLSRTRSSNLQESNGLAQAGFAGHRSDHSTGADRNVAVALSGTQTLDQLTLYDIKVGGTE